MRPRPRDQDKDALHILPLATLPLATPGLAGARLLKSADLQGVIELFSGDGMGSGQIAPEELPKAFDFSAQERYADLAVLQKLSELPSYDVYSLRLELRKLEIDVDNHDDLKVSPDKSKQLSVYMRDFTSPLVRFVYGESFRDAENLSDVLRLMKSPDADQTRRNLMRLAENLGIEIRAIPKFLEDYGDVYQSLAYYKACLDDTIPALLAFRKSLAVVYENRLLKDNVPLMRACTGVERKLIATAHQVSSALTLFREQTDEMWQDFNAEAFRSLERTITAHQSQLGGGLCALTVKLHLWAKAFPSEEAGGPQARADFVIGAMRSGLERLDRMTLAELAGKARDAPGPTPSPAAP